MTLHILLERWAKLESDLCKVVLNESDFSVFRLTNSPILRVTHSEAPEDWSWITAIVQGAVQDAILSRDGHFVVENGNPGDTRFFARISNYSTQLNYATGCDSYAGIALLSAYLDWLQEELRPKETVAVSDPDDVPL